MNQFDNGESSEEAITVVRPKHPRGVPQSQASFPRGRSNFSSGTLPNRKSESTPVNTLATGHSNKQLLTTFKMDRTAAVPRIDLEPVNRGYLVDFNLQPQRTSRNHDFMSSTKRHSLPSTHILFEKTKHRGGPNVEEQQRMGRLIRARAEEAEMNNNTRIEKEAVKLSFDVKIVGSMTHETFGYTRTHMESMKDFFSTRLKDSDVDEVTWSKTGMAPRAAYEEKAFVIEAHLVLTPNREVQDESKLFADFIGKFTGKISGMLHDQVFVEVPKMQNLFTKILPTHSSINISGIAIGNCPNPGLFLVRGDFISKENTESNVKIPQHVHENTACKVAGSNDYLSFARFEHDKRVAHLYFGVSLPEFSEDGLNHAGFRLSLYYNSITKIVVDFSNEKMNTFYIQLKNPPHLWEGVPKINMSGPGKSKVLNLETCTDWIRVLSWPGDADRRGIGCSTEAYSQSTWIRISFMKGDDMSSTKPSQLVDILSRIASRSNNTKIHFGSVFSIRRKLAPSPALLSLGTFRANYALQALITRGSVFMDQLFDATDPNIPEEKSREDGDDEEEEPAKTPMDPKDEPLFLKLVRRGMKECPQAVEETLEQLLNAFDERRSIDVLFAFSTMYKARKTQYERLLSGESLQDVGLAKPLPKNCVQVAKVIVTPSRILLMAPEVMMVNRIVRRFGPDYALRCVFRDDNLGRLAIRDFSVNNIDHLSNIVTESIFNTLKYGVQVADRKYSFLGWSNSQMRDQGCYLYAPRVDPATGRVSGTVEEIRKWMGDFREAVSVPKMMSRMGQCFTQAQPTVRLERRHWIVEPDVEGGLSGKYCFSDGCGRISVKLANHITRILELKETPACFQVRFKGFKGILVIDPTIDDIIGMPKVIFRKSQQKFGEGGGDQQDEYLEVVKYAMPSPVCLNRPFITILDQVSAKQSASSHRRITNRIHYYLERELCSLSNMLLNENQAAEELVNRTNLPIDWNKASKHAGFQLSKDPLIRSMLFSIYRYNIIHHISKAKIFLPPDLGRSMYGVVDETGLLQYGQVFIQYSQSIRQTSATPILKTGKVLITKNPCHVPGDVRVFEAVWQPALAHLVDVVVFPRHGPRPHPDEMAGSDLDGDEYSIIWDQEMLLDYNEEAMIYPSSTAPEEDKEPTTDDMVEFFLRYLQQDSIGRMSNAHLTYADLHGLFHENCRNIALKCAVAVDFPKSGVPAEPLASFEQCEMTPDYMATGGKPMYYSPRLNGQLHRKARKVEEVLEEYETRGSIFEGEYDKIICPDDADVFFGSEAKLVQAMMIRDEYIDRMQQLLDEYGIEDEASVVSGHAASIKRLAGMERDDYSFYHTDKIVELRYEKLYHVFRAKFFEEFGGEAAHLVNDGSKMRLNCTKAMREKVRQWYFVSYVQPKKNKTGKFIGQSLPWVVWDALCDLRRELMVSKTNAIPRVKYPIGVRLEEEIHKSIEQRAERFERFKEQAQGLRDAHYLRRYTKFYGDGILRTLFIIQEWLLKEGILPSDGLTIWQIGRLLIRSGLGDLKGNPTIDYEKNILNPTKIFQQWIPKKPEVMEEEVMVTTQFEMGTLILEFLRYLASQSFALAETIPLRVFREHNIVEPILYDSNQWIPFHLVAYRTFHSISVSGRFDALHLEDSDADELISESKDPILVNESSFSSQNYTDSPINRPQVLNMLKEWSGVKEMHTREVTGTRKSDLQYVTSVGTVLARQRLARLLLLSGETIRDAIANKTIPAEVRDEFL
ncbi:CBN-RRF-3 protein [Caenorhabditis brenneri]|uniref:RNA-directed RNA polymerase n=1 Tax=Caenorhabditis brenneri TaxID=135651 RepID=G0P014_CAEBE|nr:CBN-RRF-3 protein [Caenorhabditis brenneri]